MLIQEWQDQLGDCPGQPEGCWGGENTVGEEGLDPRLCPPHPSVPILARSPVVPLAGRLSVGVSIGWDSCLPFSLGGTSDAGEGVPKHGVGALA